ncbi:MAG: nucleotide exchange factor GrpE [Anaeroplasma sp.]
MTEEIKEDVKEEIKEDTIEESEEEINSQNEEVELKKKTKKNKDKELIAKLEDEIKGLNKEIANWKNEYLKAHAETENFKKRINEQTIKDRKYASQKVVGELIQPIDMLVQIVNLPASNPEVANYQIGFQMIANQLVDILKKEGLSPIEALNKEFDPNFMQAVETENDDTKEDNIVVSVRQPGYMYKDRVLRPAMVVVNKKNIDKKEEE